MHHARRKIIIEQPNKVKICMRTDKKLPTSGKKTNKQKKTKQILFSAAANHQGATYMLYSDHIQLFLAGTACFNGENGEKQTIRVLKAALEGAKYQ